MTSRIWVTPPGVPVHAGRGDGLHRVDDQQLRLDRFHVASSGGQVGLGGEVEVRGPTAPIRSARSRTWAADSSPVMYSTGPAPTRARPPPAAAWTCRPPAPRPAAPPPRAPGRRPGPGPVRRARSAGRSPRWQSTSVIGDRPAGRRPAGHGAAGHAPRQAAARATPGQPGAPARPFPTPGTRRSARTTSWCASRIPRTGTAAPADDFAMARTVPAGADSGPRQHVPAGGELPARRHTAVSSCAAGRIS